MTLWDLASSTIADDGSVFRTSQGVTQVTSYKGYRIDNHQIIAPLHNNRISGRWRLRCSIQQYAEPEEVVRFAQIGDIQIYREADQSACTLNTPGKTDIASAVTLNDYNTHTIELQHDEGTPWTGLYVDNTLVCSASYLRFQQPEFLHIGSDNGTGVFQVRSVSIERWHEPKATLLSVDTSVGETLVQKYSARGELTATWPTDVSSAMTIMFWSDSPANLAIEWENHRFGIAGSTANVQGESVEFHDPGPGWHHYVFSVPEDHIYSLYIDGHLATTAQNSFPPASYTSPTITISAPVDHVCQIGIYGTDLDSDTLYRAYHSHDLSLISENDLLGFWTLNKSLRDSSGQLRHLQGPVQNWSENHPVVSYIDPVSQSAAYGQIATMPFFTTTPYNDGFTNVDRWGYSKLGASSVQLSRGVKLSPNGTLFIHNSNRIDFKDYGGFDILRRNSQNKWEICHRLFAPRFDIVTVYGMNFDANNDDNFAICACSGDFLTFEIYHNISGGNNNRWDLKFHWSLRDFEIANIPSLTEANNLLPEDLFVSMSPVTKWCSVSFYDKFSFYDNTERGYIVMFLYKGGAWNYHQTIGNPSDMPTLSGFGQRVEFEGTNRFWTCSGVFFNSDPHFYNSILEYTAQTNDRWLETRRYQCPFRVPPVCLTVTPTFIFFYHDVGFPSPYQLFSIDRKTGATYTHQVPERNTSFAMLSVTKNENYLFWLSFRGLEILQRNGNIYEPITYAPRSFWSHVWLSPDEKSIVMSTNPQLDTWDFLF